MQHNLSLKTTTGHPDWQTCTNGYKDDLCTFIWKAGRITIIHKYITIISYAAFMLVTLWLNHLVVEAIVGLFGTHFVKMFSLREFKNTMLITILVNCISGIAYFCDFINVLICSLNVFRGYL